MSDLFVNWLRCACEIVVILFHVTTLKGAVIRHSISILLVTLNLFLSCICMVPAVLQLDEIGKFRLWDTVHIFPHSDPINTPKYITTPSEFALEVFLQWWCCKVEDELPTHHCHKNKYNNTICHLKQIHI